jgi:hypothetical protein
MFCVFVQLYTWGLLTLLFSQKITIICSDFWHHLYSTRTRWTSFACQNKYKNDILTVSALAPRLPEFNDALLPLCFLLWIGKTLNFRHGRRFQNTFDTVLLKLADCVSLNRLHVYIYSCNIKIYAVKMPSLRYFLKAPFLWFQALLTQYFFPCFEIWSGKPKVICRSSSRGDKLLFNMYKFYSSYQ